jgi:choline dehydrogenase-like flavoprotein
MTCCAATTIRHNVFSNSLLLSNLATMDTANDGGRFDYIVIGAGSARCVPAGRLTEDPDVRVLLLEGGGSDDLLEVRMPAAPYRLLDGEYPTGTGDRRAFIRDYLHSIYHPTSSVAMGPHECDPLDLELRVRGVERLRVIDASAMPTIPRGNTNAPTIALAEKAVDLIRGAAAHPSTQTKQLVEFAGGTS